VYALLSAELRQFETCGSTIEAIDGSINLLQQFRPVTSAGGLADGS
jgi:hypothetical protein